MHANRFAAAVIAVISWGIGVNAQSPSPSATPIPESVKQTDRELLQKLEHQQRGRGVEQTATQQKTAETTKATAQASPQPAASPSPAKMTGKSSKRTAESADRKPSSEKRTQKTSSTLTGNVPQPVGEYRRSTTTWIIPGLSRRERENDRERVQDFVRDFLKSGERDDMERHLSFFAPRVNFFGESGMSPPRIAQETLQYNAKWPRRSYSLDGNTDVVSDGDTYVVQFPMKYSVRNGSTLSRGRMFYTMRLVPDGDSFRIVSISEAPLR